MIEIKTKLLDDFWRSHLENKDKCPYCIPLFRNRKGEMVCLSRAENNFDLPYTRFFSDLNRAISPL